MRVPVAGVPAFAAPVKEKVPEAFPEAMEVMIILTLLVEPVAAHSGLVAPTISR